MHELCRNAGPAPTIHTWTLKEKQAFLDAVKPYFFDTAVLPHNRSFGQIRLHLDDFNQKLKQCCKCENIPEFQLSSQKLYDLLLRHLNTTWAAAQKFLNQNIQTQCNTKSSYTYVLTLRSDMKMKKIG